MPIQDIEAKSPEDGGRRQLDFGRGEMCVGKAGDGVVIPSYNVSTRHGIWQMGLDQVRVAI